MESIDVQTLERERDVDGLIAALHDSAGEVREAAARSLGNVGDERAVEPLLQVLDDSQSFSALREGAITSLGILGDTCATQPLLEALEGARRKRRTGSPSSEMRAVCQALAKLADERAAEPLLHALDEERAAHRAAAASSLAVVAGVRVGQIANYSIIEALCEALVSLMGERAVEPLIVLLREVRAEAQLEKGGWPRDGAGNLDPPRLGLTQGSLTTSLIRWLGELGDERAVAAILEWEPLKRDYGDQPDLKFSYEAGGWVGERPWPLESACIEALRNIGGDEARNAP